MFNSIEFASSDSEDENENINMSLLKKNLRNKWNPLNLPNFAFLRNFRVTKDVFRMILSEVRLDEGIRSSHISCEIQLAATLSFLAGGAYQRQIGADFITSMTQSQVSKILTSTIEKLENTICAKYIKFVYKETTKTYFNEKYGIPGVVGCIDGTHISLLKPVRNEHMFLNRKGRHSINAMIVCDENYVIMAVNAKYGGCAHDNFIWKQSKERQDMVNRWVSSTEHSRIIADMGYGLEPWVLTPYKAANDPTKLKFNEIHAKARNVIERCIGTLKTRWRVLLDERKCRYKPKKLAKIINVCVALHNICIARNVPLPETILNLNSEIEAEPIVNEVESNIRDSVYQREAEQLRDRIKNILNET